MKKVVVLYVDGKRIPVGDAEEEAGMLVLNVDVENPDIWTRLKVEAEGWEYGIFPSRRPD